MQVRQTDTLIITASSPLHGHGSNRKKEKELLIQSVDKLLQKDRNIFLFAPILGAAQEVCEELLNNKFSISVHKTIHQMNQLYNISGLNSNYYKVNKNNQAHKNFINIFPLDYKNKINLRENRFFIYINDSISSYPDLEETTVFNFPIYMAPQNLAELVSQVAPKELYVQGAYAKDFINKLKISVPYKKAIFPFHQEALF